MLLVCFVAATLLLQASMAADNPCFVSSTAAVEQALQRSKRRKLLHEACTAANLANADKMPGQAAIFGAIPGL
jgi:hypothetical protein